MNTHNRDRDREWERDGAAPRGAAPTGGGGGGAPSEPDSLDRDTVKHVSQLVVERETAILRAKVREREK